MPRLSLLAGCLCLLVAVHGQHGVAGEQATRAASAARSLDDRLKSSTIELQPTIQDGRRPVITAVAIQPKGRILATAGDDHLVRIWNREDVRLLHTLRGHRDWVRTLAFSPDGTTLASAGDDRQVLTWNVATGKQAAKFSPCDNAVNSIAYSPDGATLAAVGFDESLHLFVTSTGKLTKRIATSCEDLRSVAYAPDGNRLAAAGRLGVVVVCDVSETNVRFEIRTSLKRVRGVAYSPDGSTIVTAGEGHSIETWDAATGESKGRFSSKPGKIHAFTFCGAEQFATGGADNAIRLWDLRRGAELRQLRGHVGSVAALAYDSTTDTLVSGGFDTAIRVWRLDDSNRQDTAAKDETRTR